MGKRIGSSQSEGSEKATPSVRNFRAKHGWKLGYNDISHIEGVSDTVPDEAMSIRQIVDRFTKGRRPIDATLVREEGGYRDGANFDDQDLSKVGDMDLFEREEYTSEVRIKNEESKKLFLEKRKREERERLARRERDEQDGDTSREVEKKAKPSTKTVPKSEGKGGQGRSEASDDADANER